MIFIFCLLSKVLGEWRDNSINGQPLYYYHMNCNYKFKWYTHSNTLTQYWNKSRAPIFRQIALELAMDLKKQLYKIDMRNDALRYPEEIRKIQEQAHRIDQYFNHHPECVGMTWAKFLLHLESKNREPKKGSPPCTWRIPDLTPFIAR